MRRALFNNNFEVFARFSTSFKRKLKGLEVGRRFGDCLLKRLEDPNERLKLFLQTTDCPLRTLKAGNCLVQNLS
jgi:hypothetical protein